MAMTKAQKEARWAEHGSFTPDFSAGEKTITDEDFGIEVTVPVERCTRCGATRDEALSSECAEGM